MKRSDSGLLIDAENELLNTLLSLCMKKKAHTIYSYICPSFLPGPGGQVQVVAQSTWVHHVLCLTYNHLLF